MNRERRLEVALHAFPRRFRAARGAELRATAADAADQGDDAYGWRALADVVVAGWSERHRTRPPLGTFLRYRFANGRLPARWHAWMLDDVAGWIGLREFVWTLPFILGPSLFLQARSGASLAPPVWFVAGMCLLTVSAAFTPGRNRRRILRRHGYDPRTFQWVAPVAVAPVGPRTVVPAHPLLVGAGIGTGVAAVAAAITLIVPGVAVHRLSAGTWSMSRIAPSSLATVGWAAVGAAVVVAVASWFLRHRLTARLSVPDPLTIVRLPRRSDLLVGAAVGVGGIGVSVVPIAPLFAPVAVVVAGGAAPALVALGLHARRLEQERGVVIWLRIGHRAAVPPR